MDKGTSAPLRKVKNHAISQGSYLNHGSSNTNDPEIQACSSTEYYVLGGSWNIHIERQLVPINCWQAVLPGTIFFFRKTIRDLDSYTSVTTFQCWHVTVILLKHVTVQIKHSHRSNSACELPVSMISISESSKNSCIPLPDRRIL